MKKQSFVYIIATGLLWGTSGIFVPYLSPYGFASPQMSAVRAVRAVVSFLLLPFSFSERPMGRKIFYCFHSKVLDKIYSM